MKNPFFNLNFFSLTASGVVTDREASALKACTFIQKALPGRVFYPGNQTYCDDIFHPMASATQNATCAVNPSSVEDLSTIIKIIGCDDIRAPFAIKSGGHATNQGFSSTTGVQISMANFASISYDWNPGNSTVSFGSGLTWDQIYRFLEPYNVTVAGGRVPGVGVGLVLGGGYSWIADQYGLGVDNVVSFDLVMPNGTFASINNTSHPEVFFGLKGGLNNFGIVSGVTMWARPLGEVWGGMITYAPSDRFSQALANFSLHNTDRKAQLFVFYVQNASTQAEWKMVMFYDGGTQPSVYQPFLDIPPLTTNVGVRTFPELLDTIDLLSTNASGGFSNVVPIVNYTLPIINEIQKQANITYQQALKDKRSVAAVLMAVDPFHGAFDFETPSTYPHPRNRQVTPSNPYIVFSNLSEADYFHHLLRKMSDDIQAFAILQNQSRWDDIRYSNLALDDTPLNLLFGSNIPKLKRIKQEVDPKDIMGLTGGFKF